MQKFLYIFLDEAGNLDFSQNGTRLFLITAVTKERPFEVHKELLDLRYDLAEEGICLEYFHACEDKQPVRNRVFAIIERHINDIRIDSVIVEKNKTGPALQPVEKFYPKMIGYLLRYILNAFDLAQYAEVLVFTDSIPVQRKREAVQKAIKETLASMLPVAARYRIFHHESKSHPHLQIADYCNWALYRKHAHGDLRSYALIKRSVASEFDIFRTGTMRYY